MKEEFIFDNKPSLWQRLKKSWLSIFFALCSLMILGCLTVPDYVAKTVECQKWNLGFADLLSDTCMTKFSDIIFVVGDTQNTPAPTLNPAFKKYLITSLKDDESKISIISVSDPSRNPREIISKSETTETSDGLYSDAIEEVEQEISKASAKKNGANYLEAIRSAAEYAENKANTLIYVIGSGLSDNGLINFADGELLLKTGEEFEAKEIASKVYEAIQNQGNSESKELKGTSIIWDNIGEAVAPQPEINSDALKKVKEIYKNILQKLGAKSILFKSSSTNEASVKTNYTVKISKANEPVIVIIEEFDGRTEIFQFKGSSAEFINRQASEEKAKQYIEAVKASPSRTIHIKAFMSRGRGNCNKETLTASDRDLLNSRLEAVKGLLSGVDEAHIYTEVGGFGNINECPNGVYDEEQAKNNRLVEIKVLE